LPQLAAEVSEHVDVTGLPKLTLAGNMPVLVRKFDDAQTGA
jgi:hypothetical protein